MSRELNGLWLGGGVRRGEGGGGGGESDWGSLGLTLAPLLAAVVLAIDHLVWTVCPACL